MNKFIIFAMFCIGCAKTDPTAANKAAEEYVKNIPGNTGYSCTATDSDNDGYCSCTVFMGKAEPMQIQCGCERLCIWNCARGCKYVPQIKLAPGQVK